VVIVPTKYYNTPTELYRELGFSLVIWANHLMRSCITAMQRTAQQVLEEESLTGVEDRIAPIAEVFRLQGATELAEAERRYLPQTTEKRFPSLLAAATAAEASDIGGFPNFDPVVVSHD
jgi:phosphoenolpyruvate phosphomutase